MNVKITYVTAREYNQSMPNNGFSEEKEYIICEPPYDFESYLQDNLEYDFWYEKDEEHDNLYYITNRDTGERTGDVYMVIDETPTDEDLYW